MNHKAAGAVDATPDQVSADEVANIHLQLDGEEHCVEAPIAIGKQPTMAVLPAAQVLTGKIVELAVIGEQKEGRTISCQAGCGACCRQLVVISFAEAKALAELVAAMPAERQATVRGRFAAAVERLEQVGLLDGSEPRGSRHLIQPANWTGPTTGHPTAVRYFAEKIACPFLEEESCSIHPDRPLICREYLVTSPAQRCAKLYEEEIDVVQLAVHVAPAMVVTVHQVNGTPLESLPLVLALEWAEAHPEALSRRVEGVEVLSRLLAAIEEERLREL